MDLNLIVFWVFVGWATRWFASTKAAVYYMEMPSEGGFLEELGIVRALGGALGGLLYTRVWPIGPEPGAVEVAATAIGAILGALVLQQAYQQIMMMLGKGSR